MHLSCRLLKPPESVKTGATDPVSALAESRAKKGGLSVTAAKIHPGHEAVAQALKKEGTPPNRVLHAGFMAGDIVENAKGEPIGNR